MPHVSVKLKYFALFWCLCFTVMPFVSISVIADDTIIDGDYIYTRDYIYTIENGTVTIRSYRGSDIQIIIPSHLDGLPVTVIGNDILSHNKDVTSVIISEGISKIDDYAFFDTKLTDIVIPSSVTSIGHMAFARCKGLTQVVLPSGVAIIGYCAFAGCTNLRSIMIPASVTSIGKLAFNHGEWVDPPQYPIPGLSIIGYETTYTQSYAKANEIPFIAIKDYPAVTLGDVNADDAIDAQDALLALQQSVKTVALGEASAAMADVDKNGAINARDALLMLQYSVHLINSFD